MNIKILLPIVVVLIGGSYFVGLKQGQMSQTESTEEEAPPSSYKARYANLKFQCDQALTQLPKLEEQVKQLTEQMNSKDEDTESQEPSSDSGANNNASKKPAKVISKRPNKKPEYKLQNLSAPTMSVGTGEE